MERVQLTAWLPPGWHSVTVTTGPGVENVHIKTREDGYMAYFADKDEGAKCDIYVN